MALSHADGLFSGEYSNSAVVHLTLNDVDTTAHNVLLSSLRSTFIFCFSMTVSNSVALLASCRYKTLK